MGYNRQDFTSSEGADTFGFGGATISLAGGDVNINDTVKAVVVVSTGSVVFRPVNGASDITITSAPVGYVLPWHASVIRQSGTTATLATVIGR